MYEYNLFSLVHMTYWTTPRFEPANFFFLSFLCAGVLVNQFLFFPPLFVPPLLIYAQPNLDLNLAWRTHSHDFLISFFFWCVRHDLAYFNNDQQSKVLGRMTAQHLILISTSAFQPNPSSDG